MKEINVSIITVCYNSEATIERTIQSVLGQTYGHLEYIIVDGKSSDHTMEIVERYRPLFQGRMKVVSEPDQGIYDAMNKGICMARGSLIGIINSDDSYEPDAVEKIVHAMTEDQYQILYGMLRVMHGEIETRITMPKHENLENEMIAHPTCFVTKSVYEDFGMFDLRYRSCADHDFMLRMRKQKEIVFVPVYEILATFSEGYGMCYQESSMIEALGMLAEHGIMSRKKYCLIHMKYRIKNFFCRKSFLGEPKRKERL